MMLSIFVVYHPFYIRVSDSLPLCIWGWISFHPTSTPTLSQQAANTLMSRWYWGRRDRGRRDKVHSISYNTEVPPCFIHYESTGLDKYWPASPDTYKCLYKYFYICDSRLVVWIYTCCLHKFQHLQVLLSTVSARCWCHEVPSPLATTSAGICKHRYRQVLALQMLAFYRSRNRISTATTPHPR